MARIPLRSHPAEAGLCIIDRSERENSVRLHHGKSLPPRNELWEFAPPRGQILCRSCTHLPARSNNTTSDLPTPILIVLPTARSARRNIHSPRTASTHARSPTQPSTASFSKEAFMPVQEKIEATNSSKKSSA